MSAKVSLEQAAVLVRIYMRQGQPVFIWGAPGIGKSDIVRAIADEDELPVIDLRALLLDPVDLRGLPTTHRYETQDADGKTIVKIIAEWAQAGILPHVDKHGPNGILFLDELNAAPPATQAACYQLVLDRRVGEYVLPDGWQIVAAGNRAVDKAVTNRMPTPLANRFAHVDAEYDHASWLAWAKRTGEVDPYIVAFINQKPSALWAMNNTSDLRAFPTPRTWHKLSKVLGGNSLSFGKDDLAEALRAPIRKLLASGLVGEPEANAFEAYLSKAALLPTIEQILADPMHAKVPSGASDVYLIQALLNFHIKQETLDPIVSYALRMPKENEQALMLEALAEDGSLVQEPAFTRWTRETRIRAGASGGIAATPSYIEVRGNAKLDDDGVYAIDEVDSNEEIVWVKNPDPSASRKDARVAVYKKEIERGLVMQEINLKGEDVNKVAKVTDYVGVEPSEEDGRFAPFYRVIAVDDRALTDETYHRLDINGHGYIDPAAIKTLWRGKAIPPKSLFAEKSANKESRIAGLSVGDIVRVASSAIVLDGQWPIEEVDAEAGVRVNAQTPFSDKRVSVWIEGSALRGKAKDSFVGMRKLADENEGE